MKVLFENGRYYVDPVTSDEEGFLARCVLHKTHIRATIDPAQQAGLSSGFAVAGSGAVLGDIASMPRN